MQHQFSIGQRDSGRVWSLCVPRGDYWDPKGLPDPYGDVVRLFKEAASSN